MTATTTPSATPERVVIIGGSSGMGLALARALLAAGAEVTVAGRSPDRLAAAAQQLAQLAGPGRLRTVVADVTSEPDVEGLLAGAGTIDHVVVTATDARGAYQPVATFDADAARDLIAAKLLGPVVVAKHAAPRIAPGGSVTFTSGIAAYRPLPGATMVAAVNGALASIAAALAVELAPIRVNVVSPGWVDTPVWDAIAGADKRARLAAMAGRLPVGRVGQPDDIAKAFLALLHNGFITGTVLHVDGGHRLV
jgi:NAD(P)-dependent dehydrogenase (short-subunit alcohol dehydrogenase family)